MSSVRNEFFLLFLLEDFEGSSLPTNGDVLRCFFGRRRDHPKEPERTAARHVVDRCIKIWQAKGIPTTQECNGVKYLLKLLGEFDLMKSEYNGYTLTRQLRTLALWREQCDLLFSVATKNALKRCGEVGRELLLAARDKKKQFSKAAKRGTPIEPRAAERRAKPGPKSSKVKAAAVQGEVRPHPKSPEKPKANGAVVTASTIFRQGLHDVAAATKPSIEDKPAKVTVWIGEFNMRFPVGVVKAEPVAEVPIAPPPPVQNNIFKEEIQLGWDPADEHSTELLFADKENVAPPAIAQKSFVKEEVDLKCEPADDFSTEPMFSDKRNEDSFVFFNQFSGGDWKF